MNNTLKSIGALISSCFLMFSTDAMQNQKSSEATKRQNCYYKIVKYPDFSRTLRTIDIEVIYEGKKERIDSIYLYLSMMSRDKGLSKYNIQRRVKEKFPKMSDELGEELAEQCYTKAEDRFLKSFIDDKKS